MKPIIFNDGTSETTVELSLSKAFVIICGDDGETQVDIHCIDKLIEALYLVKKELNLD